MEKSRFLLPKFHKTALFLEKLPRECLHKLIAVPKFHKMARNMEKQLFFRQNSIKRLKFWKISQKGVTNLSPVKK